MAFNVFKKIYVAPEYAYDVGYNRYIFSADRDDDYTASTLNDPSYDTTVGGWNTVSDMVGTGEGQYESVAHFLKHLYDTDWKGRIYCDSDSYIQFFCAWLKIAMPNYTNDSAFIVYNLIKQREELVFPDGATPDTWIAPRLADKEAEVVLTKDQFITKLNEFNTNDTNPDSYYDTVRAAVRDELCVEIQLASHLSGAVGISSLAAKIDTIVHKQGFGVIEDIKDYILDNALTPKVRTMTGVTIGWEDQDWEGTLRAQSSNMDFLFSSTVERIIADSTYRTENNAVALAWCQWILDNTNDADESDMQLADIIAAAQYVIDYQNVISANTSVRDTTAASLLTADIAYQSTSFLFNEDSTREKINTFWIEYIYQMKGANNTTALSKMSHT